MKISVLIEKGQENWAASSADNVLHGVIAVCGDSREDALNNFRQALSDHIEIQTERGIKIPSVTKLEIKELVLL